VSIVLEIDTKKTLHEPKEIKVNGKLFRVKPITLRNLEAIQTLWQDAQAGSAAAIRKMITSILDGPIDILIDLEIDRLNEVITAAVSRAASPDAKEKNESGPAEEKLPS